MKRYLILGAIALTFMACEKDDADNSSAISSQPGSFQEITVSPNFSWSTETEYSLRLVAIKNMPFSTSNFIEVRDVDGKLIFKSLATTADNKTLKFKASGDLGVTTVSFGSINKEIVFINTSAEFDFIPFDDQSDIEPEN